MNQYIFSIKLTASGKHYCVAYTASGNEPVAVSRKNYDNGNDAMQDVLTALGLVQPIGTNQSNQQTFVPSAAAGGVR
jgi:hypothetical protein